MIRGPVSARADAAAPEGLVGRPDAACPQGTGTVVRSVERALMLLEALATASSPAHLSELAQATGLAKTTVHRMLNALVLRGFATRADGGYTLGTRLFQLAAEVSQVDRLQQRFMPFLLELHLRTRGAISVGILSGSQVLYSGSVHDYQGTPFSREVAPAHCTALGKLLLAYQPQAVQGLGGPKLERLTRNTVSSIAALHMQLVGIRRRGVAYAFEERVPGEWEVAAPVFADNGQVATGLSVAGTAGRLELEAVVMHVTQVARQASLQGRADAREAVMQLARVAPQRQDQMGFSAAESGRSKILSGVGTPARRYAGRGQVPQAAQEVPQSSGRKCSRSPSMIYRSSENSSRPAISPS
jgi:IclR family transcriptional regulator, KDG regulon repressor